MPEYFPECTLCVYTKQEVGSENGRERFCPTIQGNYKKKARTEVAEHLTYTYVVVRRCSIRSVLFGSSDNFRKFRWTRKTMLGPFFTDGDPPVVCLANENHPRILALRNNVCEHCVCVSNMWIRISCDLYVRGNDVFARTEVYLCIYLHVFIRKNREERKRDARNTPASTSAIYACGGSVTLMLARNQVTRIKLTYIPLSSVLSSLIKRLLTVRLCVGEKDPYNRRFSLSLLLSFLFLSLCVCVLAFASIAHLCSLTRRWFARRLDPSI